MSYNIMFIHSVITRICMYIMCTWDYGQKTFRSSMIWGCIGSRPVFLQYAIHFGGF